MLAIGLAVIVVGTCAPAHAQTGSADVERDRATAAAGTIQPGDLPAGYAQVAPASGQAVRIDAVLPDLSHVKGCRAVVSTFAGRRAGREPPSAEGATFESGGPTGVRTVVSAFAVYRDELSVERAFAPLAARAVAKCLEAVIVRRARETSVARAGDPRLKVSKAKSAVSRDSGPRIGDRSIGYRVRITITLQRESVSRTTNELAAVQFVRVGRAIGVYAMFGSGASVDDQTWRPVVAAAASRLQPASALDTLNEFRADVGAPPVDPTNTVAGEAQAVVTCLAAGGQGSMPTPHTPDPALRCNGAADFDLAASGGMNSVISIDDPGTPARSVVEELVRAPYHGLTLALPSLVGVAYSEASSPSGGSNTAVRPRQFTAVDVFGAGTDDGRMPTRSLMSWPAGGVSVPGSVTTNEEWPDAVRACGWQRAGPPMWVGTGILTGLQAGAFEVTNVELSDAHSRPVATQWCRISRATNPHTDPNERATVDQALGLMNAEVWIPSTPLRPGRYRVSWSTSYGNVAADFVVQRSDGRAGPKRRGP